MSEYKATDGVVKTDCIYCDREPNETAYCNKWHKYLDNGCGECKVVTLADVVEVVRCKDCKGYTPADETYGTCYAYKGVYGKIKPTDYCSYGERKEEENE